MAIAKGSIDVAKNGLTLQNAMQILGSGLGLAGDVVALSGLKRGIATNVDETVTNKGADRRGTPQ